MSAAVRPRMDAQLTRSLERILDEAALSGELRLSGRKLRDFPKTSKHQLQDTLAADLSKNRFCDVPDEVTAFYFLERLLLYHNAIRSIPDTIGMLHSLTYLDLSRNQLTELPRELCQLPLQVLLLSSNRLTSLPKEINKMSTLTELDASGNQIAQLPMTIGDLFNLKALNLKCNQLCLLPIQITYLQLEILDISCNCISSLPVELRQMSSLVTLNLEHNPLVFPPAMVCVRGRIHIFKYLENQINKDNPQKRNDDSKRPVKHPHPLLSYNVNHPQIANTLMNDGVRHKNRYNVDSGYSTSDGGEKRWSSDGLAGEEMVILSVVGHGSGRSTPSTPSTISPGPTHLSRATSLSAETPPATPNLGCRISPEGANVNNEDKMKLAGAQQTYRQYKEALRQQRQQDLYRPRGEQISPPSHSTPHSPVANGYHKNMVSSNPSLTSINGQNSPTATLSSLLTTPRRFSPNGIPHINGTDDSKSNLRPVQKVIPSRNSVRCFSPTGLNSYDSNKNSADQSQENGYTKPTSPVKGSSVFMSHNTIPVNKSNSLGRNYKTSPTEENCSEPSAKLLTSKIAWNKELSADKLSFTMKREFDRAKEESELIQQLRSIIENRLKMVLPSDLAPVLSDGVVLCHLANHVRPRSVASVHVPSATQPKLTMARCRRNVDNFLEACRKIGVEEEAVCQPQDILLQENGTWGGSFERIHRTVIALLARRTVTTASNATANHEDHYGQTVETYDRETYGNLVDSDQSSAKSAYVYNHQKNYHRSRYSEDRCISSFNTTYMGQKENLLQNNNEKETYDNNETAYDPKHSKNSDTFISVSEKIKYFSERRHNMNLDIKNNLNAIHNQPQIGKNDKIISWFCIFAFMSTLIVLYVFPLPN